MDAARSGPCETVSVARVRPSLQGDFPVIPDGA
jgi:hypothetical protein